MIEKYVNEFISIYSYLTTKDFTVKLPGYLAAPKQEIDKLLLKYLYAEPKDKLKLWKAFQWIRCDDNRLTSKVSQGGKRIHMVVMSDAAYTILCKTQGKKPTEN